MAILVNDDPKSRALLQRERCAKGPEIRAQLVQVALGLCELEVKDFGEVATISEEDGKPPVSPRNKLAAMQILRSLDRNAVEPQRVEQAMEAQNIEDVPVSDGLPPLTLEEDDPRRPINRQMREAILQTALGLCGLKVMPEGAVEPSGRALRKRRIVLRAMRMVAAFGGRSIDQKQLKHLRLPDTLREKRRRWFVMDQEIARKVDAFLHDERVKLRDKILSEEKVAEVEAAVAQAQALATSA
jgi:hypothetical protein